MAAQTAVAEFAGSRRFEVLRRLGAGGMGVVYAVLDRERNTQVALKTLRRLTAEALLRFKTEFRALQDVQHRNLVALGELFEEDQQWFFTMELVDGIQFLQYVRRRAGGDPSSHPLAITATGYSDETPSGDVTGSLVASATAARERGPFDEARLRQSVEQLSRGLMALHGARKVHRDIKSSNVLVRRDGRVVILDFGLIAEWDAVRSPGERGVVGTSTYMAPEQAARGRVGPEADWYSVGVLLYMALTGRAPFDGAPEEVMAKKQQAEAPLPSAWVPGLPPDLADLCAALLRKNPAERPRGAEVLQRLGVDDPPALVLEGGAPFVGRRRELESLKQAFAAVRSGTAVTCLLQGESGVGKSALVRRFTAQLGGDHAELVLLAGRCYESESVPYKGVDGVIDALSRWLVTHPLEVAALLPPEAVLLAQAFPVLRRVRQIAEAPQAVPRSRDAHDMRVRMFLALREVLARIAARRPVVVVIDDLQWSDADSLALLGEVMRPPAPPLLLLCSMRSGHALPAPSGLGGDVRRLRLDSLAPDEARELVIELLRAVRDPVDLDARAIADEAAGHPLFIDELVRHAALPRVIQGGADAKPGRQRLEEALWARIARLDAPARRLLEVIAVAGSPVPESVAVQAADTASIDSSILLGRLRVAHIVRTVGGDDNLVEPYHDRVRQSVLAHMEPERLRDCHRGLALALGAWGRADPEAQAVHWHGAAEPREAARYAAVAAGQARAALAFDRAARLYRMALELRPAAPDEDSDAAERQELRVQLGDALVDAGRGYEAAQAYRQAAKNASGTARLELERRAAEQLLRSGHIDEGLEVIGEVLAAVGEKLPRTPRAALLSFLLRRAQLRLRGLKFRERTRSEVGAEALTRIDISWAVSTGLAIVDNVRGADFQTRNLLLALDAGEPYRIARALAMEGSYIAATGPRAADRADHLFATAESLARRIRHDHALGAVYACRACATYLLGRFRESRALADTGIEIFDTRCTGASWETDSAQIFAVWSLYYLGEIAELGRRVPRLVAQAVERGDRYAATTLRSGLGNFWWLAQGDVAEARRHLTEALQQWSQQGFHYQHYSQLLAQASIDICDGAGAGAYRRLTERWPALEKSMFLRVQAVRIESTHLRARAALAAAATAEDPRPYLAAAARDARRLVGEKSHWGRPLGQLVEAALLHQRGETAAAVARLENAAAGCEAADLALFATVARRRRGELVGGDEGRAQSAAADAWMRAQDILAPDIVVSLLGPGFDRHK